jgi:hypothetical protein
MLITINVDNQSSSVDAVHRVEARKRRKRNKFSPKRPDWYVVVSKIFRTGATIYTAVMVARSTGKW